MNHDIAYLREEVFAQYRESKKVIDDISEKMNDAYKVINALDTERSTAYEKSNYLKSLIDIMITTDCDPVMAKLKYNEELSKCEVGTDAAYLGQQSMIGSYNSNIVNQTNSASNRVAPPSIIKKVMRAFN
jgi:hypothetical protein